ncbi:MAG: DUF3179 domain-containing protein, partial [Dongiaceae bacterium]
LAVVAWLRDHGGSGAVAPLIQVLRFQRADRLPIVAALKKLTGADPGETWFDWMLWQEAHPEIRPYDGFTGFVAEMLSLIDPQFGRFLRAGVKHEIRVEEITWGGVAVDGIPALDRPRMTSVGDAAYLNDDDPVFGVEINGDARAYPRRILAWHEMFNDVVGGVPVSLAYCTLCGAAILFDGRVPGRAEAFTFGSSGLLYRSNKLMYDRQTDSLWNQFTGRPVVGPLTGSGIELKILPIVIASWAEWRQRNPETRVLSIDTGFQRDYGSGVAYREYFASPDLMFPAAVKDGRLAAKDQVFGIRAPGGTKAWPLSAFAGGKVINDKVGLLDIVLVGDGADHGVRAYEARGRHFEAGSDADTLRATDGVLWRITEAELVSPDGASLPRLPGHVAYWFAWSGYLENATLFEALPAAE